MPQEILSDAGNIPQHRIISCYRKYFLSQKIFPFPDNITCPSVYSLLPRKYFLPQETVIDDLSHTGISTQIAGTSFVDLQEIESSHISCQITIISFFNFSFLFLRLVIYVLHTQQHLKYVHRDIQSAQNLAEISCVIDPNFL